MQLKLTPLQLEVFLWGMVAGALAVGILALIMPVQQPRRITPVYSASPLGGHPASSGPTGSAYGTKNPGGQTRPRIQVLVLSE